MIKRLYIGLVLVCLATWLHAQNFEIRAVVVDATTVGIEMRETSGTGTPSDNDFIYDLVFGLKWDNSADNDIGSIDNSSGYSIGNGGSEGIKGSEEFKPFAFNGSIPFSFPETWMEDVWVEICQIASDNGDFTGTMEICPVGFDDSTEPNIGLGYGMGPIEDYTPTINGSANFTVLPAVLSKFEVMKRDGFAYLLWCVVTEINVSHYEIEKSSDGVNWSYIGEVRADGITFGTVDYAYEDLSSFEANTDGTVYYRLKMVDLDGSYEYSEVRTLDFGARNIHSLTVYPNPASNSSSIVFSDNHDFNSLSLLDVSGRLLYKTSVKNLQQLNLDFEKLNLNEGMYLLFFKSSNQKQTVEKLLVK